MTKTRHILTLTALLAVALPGTALAKGPKARLQFSQAAYAVAENGGSATIKVVRNGNAKRVAQAASVDVATSDGTAVAGVDYTEHHETLTFASGEAEKTFTVAINDKDSVNTGPRTINLKLSHPTATNGAVLGYPSTATLVISDDDTSNGGGGTTPPTFQVAAAEEIVGEPAGSQAYNLYIIRSGDLNTDATIGYATEPGSAIDGNDYTGIAGTKTFPIQTPGSTASIIQEVPVTLLHNPAATPTTRSFKFNLNVPSGSSSLLGNPASETITIVNRDGTPTVQFSAPSYSVAETGGSVRLTVFAAGDVTSDLDVGYKTVDGTAVAGVNYTAQNDTLQFMAADAGVAQSFDVPVMADGQLGDKFFTGALDATTTSPGVTIGTPNAATVSVLNTDAPTNNSGGSNDNGTGAGTGGGQGTQTVLDVRQAACGLTVNASKKQKLLKQKTLKLTVKTAQRCKVTVSTLLTQVKAKKKTVRSAKALRFKARNASLTLQPGKASTVKVKFTKKTLKAITKALRARKNLVATVVVTSKDSASKVTRKTLKITIRR
jgi:hypothetical protein